LTVVCAVGAHRLVGVAGPRARGRVRLPNGTAQTAASLRPEKRFAHQAFSACGPNRPGRPCPTGNRHRPQSAGPITGAGLR